MDQKIPKLQKINIESDLTFKIYYQAIKLDISLLNLSPLNSTRENEKNLSVNSENKAYINLNNDLKKIREEIVNNFIDLSELLMKETIKNQKTPEKLHQKESKEIISFIENQIEIVIKFGKYLTKLTASNPSINESIPQKNIFNFQLNHKDLIFPWWLNTTG